MSDHTSKQFDAEMESIRSGVLTMGGLIERQFNRAIAALESDEDRQLLDAVGADEQKINQMQMDIDQECGQIIARRQPAAIDLQDDPDHHQDRQRPGAYRRRGQEDRLQGAPDRRQRQARPGALLRRRAFGDHGAEACCRWHSMPSPGSTSRPPPRWSIATTRIDAAFSSILRQLLSYMMEDPRTIGPAMEIVFIAKFIERIGDHAKNIAEGVVQVVKGKDVRHASAEQIRAEVASE